MTTQDALKPYFFGYGSLVNRRTHGYGDIQTAKLVGWRRVWRQTTFAPRPILTAEPCEGVTIEGLIAHVPNGNWEALDQREHAYDRVPVHDDVQRENSREIDIATYVIPESKYPAAPEPRPIYLSYLDVVVQGYLAEFGEAGAQAFFDTTAGWDAPIRNDRDDPIYPRHQTLTDDETHFVDDALTRLGSQFLD